MRQTGNNRATQFLIQKIAIDVQPGNSASEFHRRRIGQSIILCHWYVDLQMMTSMQC